MYFSLISIALAVLYGIHILHMKWQKPTTALLFMGFSTHSPFPLPYPSSPLVLPPLPITLPHLAFTLLTFHSPHQTTWINSQLRSGYPISTEQLEVREEDRGWDGENFHRRECYSDGGMILPVAMGIELCGSWPDGGEVFSANIEKY